MRAALVSSRGGGAYRFLNRRPRPPAHRTARITAAQPPRLPRQVRPQRPRPRLRPPQTPGRQVRRPGGAARRLRQPAGGPAAPQPVSRLASGRSRAAGRRRRREADLRRRPYRPRETWTSRSSVSTRYREKEVESRAASAAQSRQRQFPQHDSVPKAPSARDTLTILPSPAPSATTLLPSGTGGAVASLRPGGRPRRLVPSFTRLNSSLSFDSSALLLVSRSTSTGQFGFPIRNKRRSPTSAAQHPDTRGGASRLWTRLARATTWASPRPLLALRQTLRDNRTGRWSHDGPIDVASRGRVARNEKGPHRRGADRRFLVSAPGG